MKDLIILGVFSQIRDAIIMLKQWNADVEDIHDLEKSPEGMQRMAGNCMMIQAIGEGSSIRNRFHNKRNQGHSSYK